MDDIYQLYSKLIKTYEYLSSEVSARTSSTARIIRHREIHHARDKIILETEQAIAVLQNNRLDKDEKTRMVSALLKENNISDDKKDLVLELSRISYWYIVYSFAEGKIPDPDLICRSLEQGSRETGKPEILGEHIYHKISTETVYRFIGRALALHQLPLSVLAQLDFKEIESRSYLRDFLAGS